MAEEYLGTAEITEDGRKGYHITTYTGKWFYPLSPEAEKLDIADIAHALSLICRGNGHVQTFFSVGQHCIHCAKEALARGYNKRIALACLLHDASECYMSDVPRPLKKSMPEYVEIEKQLLTVIYETFLGSDLTEEEKHIVKQIDDDELWYDMRNLLGEYSDGKPQPELKAAISYEVQPFESVEMQYLELFRQLSGV